MNESDYCLVRGDNLFRPQFCRQEPRIESLDQRYAECLLY
jgi:hypothetical protein